MAGPWEKYGAAPAPSSGGLEAQRLPDPYRDRAEARADANSSRQARSDAARLKLEERRMALAEAAARNKPAGGGSARPALTPKVRSDALTAYNDGQYLAKLADELEDAYKKGPGSTPSGSLSSLLDYVPTGANKVMNDRSFQARGLVKRALGFTGGEGNTVGEIQLNYGPYLPEASDRDEQIVDKIKALRGLAENSRKRAVMQLGGRPDGNGSITPVSEQPPSGWKVRRIK